VWGCLLCARVSAAASQHAPFAPKIISSPNTDAPHTHTCTHNNNTKKTPPPTNQKNQKNQNQKVLDMRNEQIQVMQESKEVTQQFDDALDAPLLTLTAVGGQPISLTSDMLKELSPEQIYKIYQT
jgi:hypothetical protein